MVWFTFSFLLGIPNGPSNADDKPKKNSEKLQVTKYYKEIEVNKPIFTCHIEYVIFPTDPPKQIDVICWDEVAKIYHESTSIAMRPLVVHQLRWIHFRVNHKLKLHKNNVLKFYSHNIRIIVSLSNKKFGERAKSDNVKKFYCPNFPENEEEYPIKIQLFQSVSETLEELYSVNHFREYMTPRQQLYISLDSTMETSENYKQLYAAMQNLSNEYIGNDSVKTPSPPPQELPPIKNLLRSESETTTTEEKKEKEKKTTTENLKDPGGNTIEFLIPGEIFFSGRKTVENCAKYNSPALPYLFNLIKVRNILTKAQAEYYNPMTVFLSHCTSMPADSLRRNGVTGLKFQYVICDEYLVKSNLIPIDDNMKLNFSRTILTDKTDKNRLIQFLQTNGLKVEIFGDFVEEKADTPRRVYDDAGDNCQGVTDSCQRNYVTDSRTDSDGFVLLGTGFIDISSVLLQPHRILFKCNLQIPPKDYFLDAPKNSANVINIYELYKVSTNKKNFSLCHLKASASPVLTVSVRMGHPLTKIYHKVSANTNLLNRLFAVIYDKSIVTTIIQIIENETREILEPLNHCKRGINVRRPLTKNYKGVLVDFLGAHPRPQMSGFFIDSINKTLLFVEGPINSNLQKIWTLLSYMQPSQGHVLYDTSLIFTERLYSNFLKHGGFLRLNLQSDAEAILFKPKRCSKLPLPNLAWKAINSLKFLIHSKSIKTAIQNDLFPDYQSLNSLAIEFGIPIQMYNK